MAKEFSLDDIDFQKKETDEMDQLPSVKPSSTVSIETMGFFEGKSEIDEKTMECDDDDDDDVDASSDKEQQVGFQKL